MQVRIRLSRKIVSLWFNMHGRYGGRTNVVRTNHETRRRRPMAGQGKQETIDRIKEAFWSLYEHKPLSDITVKQITNVADFNRGTFYLYFDNIRQVLDQIEDDLIEDMVGDRDANSMLSFLLVQRPLDEELEGLSSIFFEHQRHLVVLFGDNGDPAFSRKLKEAIKAKLSPEVQRMSDCDPAAVDLALEYILSGEFGLLTKLFTNPGELDADSLKDTLNLIQVVTTAMAF